MGLVRRVLNRVLDLESAKIGTTKFAASLWDRLHGLDSVFDDCEGANVLDTGSYEALISYECVRRGARLAHAFARDRFLIERAAKWLAVRTVEDPALETAILDSGLERVEAYEGIEEQRGPLMIYRRNQ
jgi:hypothetical protein